MKNPKPGRELDALIAEKVMGLDVIWDTDEPVTPIYNCNCALGGEYKKHTHYKAIPCYSTNIAAAWGVLEQFTSVQCLEKDAEGWYCGIWDVDSMTMVHALRKTAPHAICLAALKAVNIGDEE